jgi:hypothetical protein
MVGNGATDWLYDNNPTIPQTLEGMGLIPKKMLQDYVDSGCVSYFRDVLPSQGGEDCDA